MNQDTRQTDVVVDGVVSAISNERLRPFVLATEDIALAIDLYGANLKLSQDVYALTGGLEVALRNAIIGRLKRYLGREDWYRSRAFMVNLSRSRRLNLKSARQRLKQEGKVEKSGAVIAGLTFHFWVALHESKYRDTLWTPMLRHIWPKGENLRRVHRDLFLVRDLRNRVAHYEPIFSLKWLRAIEVLKARFDKLAPEKALWFDELVGASIERELWTIRSLLKNPQN